ncbi:MAG: glycosyl transferase family protein [Parcubacteria group bacterium Gr01-1014_44]|nr:MAG: glycosyl transferase family protein [Parcubacteria group bacterium Gr01-1014_44]
MSPRVFIIILQYNHSQDTIKCLDSVGKLTYPNFQTVVVDNASQSSEKDNIKNYIKSQGNIVLLENEKNLGYAGGNNTGIKYALAHGADYVFILNNDTTVPPDLLEKLVNEGESDSKIGIVGPAIKEGDGRIAYYGKISWLKAELKHVYGKSAIHLLENSRATSRGSRVGGMADFPDRVRVLGPKEYVIGAGMLIKKEVLEKIDGFDEVYFLYFEDADLCLRAQLAGYKLKIAPETMIYHQGAASTSTLGKPLLLRYHMRNALIFNSLNAPWPVKFSLIFWSSYILLKNFLKVFLLPSKVTAGEAIIDGVLDFYKNNYGKINTPN